MNDLNARIDRLKTTGQQAAQLVARDLEKFDLMREVDVEMALVRARRSLDFMLRGACKVSGIEPGTRPMDNLISELQKAGTLPPVKERHCRFVKDLGNIAAHGLEQASVTAEDDGISTTELEMCASALGVITDWFLQDIVPRMGGDAPFLVIHGREVTSTLIAEMIEIDNRVYRDEFRGTLDVCLEWHRANPEIYTAVIDRSAGRVAGYINAMPLEDEYFAAILSGTVIDMTIPARAIRAYELPDFYKLYVSSIAIAPEFQGSALYGILYEAYLDKLLRLARQDMFMEEVIADTITEPGERLAKFAGMTRIRDTLHQSAIYHVRMFPPNLRCTTTAGRNLVALYQRKYSEFEDVLAPPGAL